MEEIKLSDINLLDVGHSIQIAGVVWSGNGKSFIVQFPDKKEDFSNLQSMPLTLPEWQQLLRQTDLLETEILKDDGNGLVKSIVRKTARQIDAYAQWRVFQRDGYACRYCGRTGIPLTVDHIDLWEEGGVSTEENMLAACKNCNKDRGSMKYEDWITSKKYESRSAHLSGNQKVANQIVINQLPYLRSLRMSNIRSR